MSDTENTLNIDEVVARTDIRTAVSRKSGKPYKVLVLTLSNGYEVKVFPHHAEVAVIEQLAAGAK